MVGSYEYGNRALPFGPDRCPTVCVVCYRDLCGRLLQSSRPLLCSQSIVTMGAHCPSATSHTRLVTTPMKDSCNYMCHLL
jgi:hypothetical protein